MQQNSSPRASGAVPGHARRALFVLAASSPVLLAGCLSPYAKHASALASATTPVVDQASAAYHSANTLHSLTLEYDAYARFDKQPPYNPRNAQPLLSDHDIDVRLTILAAFQLYVQNIVQITSGTDSPQLQAASASVGASLTGFANTLAPTVEGALNIAAPTSSSTATYVTTSGGETSTSTTTTITSAPAVGKPVQNGISTAVDALGQFLARRKIRKELPAIVVKMDGELQPFFTLLEKDIALLEDQERRDYDTILDDQTRFIRDNPTLNPAQRREEIMKLPGIAAQQRESQQQLDDLRAAIARLALTHFAFAAEVQGNNPESLKSKLADLAAAASDLGKFYTSLPQ